MVRRMWMAGVMAVCVTGLGGSLVWAQGNQVTPVPIVASSEFLLVGDGNCNGVSGVTSTDAQLLKMFLAGTKMPSHTEHIRCDANQNGRLDHDDVRKILSASVGTMRLPISAHKKGDADGSGSVTAYDAALVAYYLEHDGSTSFTSIVSIIRALLGDATAIKKVRMYNADCNSDGSIDDRDVKGALNIAIGLTCL